MKIKYNWLVLAITAIASLGLSVWRSVVIDQGGEFFLDKSMYSVVIFGIIIFALIIGAILTVLDRETPQTYNIGKNFFAGFFGLLISICYITDGVLGFMSLSSITEYNNIIFYIITKIFELVAGGVFLMESISSLIGKNLLKSKPIFTIVVPIMFALRLINLFFVYTKISVQSSEMFDIVAVALASLFIYYHAVMFAGLKKSCIKSMFFFGVPMICACLVSGADIVVTAVLAGKFSISAMIVTVADILLCFYAISILAEITHKAGKQYLNEVEDEAEPEADDEQPETSGVVYSQKYNSFEDIASFGKSSPHIRRETILSEPAASVEPKAENPEIASHADALHSKLQSNFEQQTAEEQTIQNKPISAPTKPENSISEETHTSDDASLSDSNPEIKSEPIPEPTPSQSSYTPTTDGVDMDRINRLLLELENDGK